MLEVQSFSYYYGELEYVAIIRKIEATKKMKSFYDAIMELYFLFQSTQVELTCLTTDIIGYFFQLLRPLLEQEASVFCLF